MAEANVTLAIRGTMSESDVHPTGFPNTSTNHCLIIKLDAEARTVQLEQQLAKEWTVQDPNPGRTNRFSLLHTIQPPVQWLLGLFPGGVKQPGMVWTTHSHLVPLLRTSRVISVLPNCAFMACHWRHLSA